MLIPSNLKSSNINIVGPNLATGWKRTSLRESTLAQLQGTISKFLDAGDQLQSPDASHMAQRQAWVC